MVWYSHLFQNFPQFIVIYTVKGFGIVNKAEIDVFLELSCFFHDPAGVGNLISGFRKGRGTRDQTANFHWIIEKVREFQKNIYFCFVDYAKAFDCVDHNKVWKPQTMVLKCKFHQGKRTMYLYVVLHKLCFQSYIMPFVYSQWTLINICNKKRNAPYILIL